MTITIDFTWHLIMMLIISVAIIIICFWNAAEHGEWSVLIIIPLVIFLALAWGIYGGIVWW